VKMGASRLTCVDSEPTEPCSNLLLLSFRFFFMYFCFISVFFGRTYLISSSFFFFFFFSFSFFIIFFHFIYFNILYIIVIIILEKTTLQYLTIYVYKSKLKFLLALFTLTTNGHLHVIFPAICLSS
jgi:hypothetical protein